MDISKYEFVRMRQKECWGVLMRKDCELAQKEYICPEDLLGIPLITTKRESVRNEIANWFGEHYDKIKTAVICDLLYNTSMLVKNGVGAAVCLESIGISEDLCFKPLMPALETGAVFVWKKNTAISPAVREFVSHIKMLEKH